MSPIPNKHAKLCQLRQKQVALAPSSLKLLRHESEAEEEANAQAEAQEKMSRGTSKLACPPTQAEEQKQGTLKAGTLYKLLDCVLLSG